MQQHEESFSFLGSDQENSEEGKNQNNDNNINDDHDWIQKYFDNCLKLKGNNCDEKVRLLYETLLSECKQDVKLNVIECDNHARAYYQRRYLNDGKEERRIIVCKNHVLNESELNEVLRHELIHSIDDAPLCSIRNFNLRKLDDRSCSEIRASYWAECGSLLRDSDENQPSKIHFQCVKHTAVSI